jgi:hypothetical protein
MEIMLCPPAVSFMDDGSITDGLTRFGTRRPAEVNDELLFLLATDLMELRRSPKPRVGAL